MELQVKSKDLILKWELTNMGKKVVIIGGGVIGMSTAFHLANNGIKDITIIEKDSIEITNRSLGEMKTINNKSYIVY